MSGESYVEYVTQDLLGAIGGVRARAMFGGHGLYRHGVLFGIIADEALYFKVDDTNRPDYERAGSKPFSYEVTGRREPVVMRSYWEVPAEVQEDPHRIERWVERSCRAQEASSARKSHPASGKPTRARSSGG